MQAHAAKGLAAMNKRFLILIIAFGMMIHTSGCSSGGTQEEGDVATSNDTAFTEEGDSDFANQLPEGSGGDVAATDQPPADGAAPAENPGELTDAGATPPAEGALAENGAAAPPADGGELSLDGDAPPAVAGATPPADGSAPLDGAAPTGAGELSLDDKPLPDDLASGAAPANGGAPVAANDPGATAASTEPPVASDPPPTDDSVFAGGEKSAGTTVPQDTAAADPGASGTTDGSNGSTETAAAAPAAYSPLVKVKDAAFQKKGALLNRVYLGRAGDTPKSVSKKIYGDASHTKDLTAWNGFLKRGVKTGDKIYYSSSHDPNDTRMLTYYEDVGVQPSTYTTKEGDNIRKVAKQLLGSSDSWKEVWATNASVESKGDIPAGLELKYWPEGAAAGAAVQMAGGGKPKKGAPGEMPPDMGLPPDALPPSQASNPPSEMPTDMQPPPPVNVAGNDPQPPTGAQMPPPGPGPASTPNGGTAGTTGAPPPDQMVPPPPPPPPVAEVPPAPPKPKPKVAAQPADAADASATDPDTIMAVGFGGILLLAAAVLFVVIRKNRAKRMDLGQTQV
jgi:hypothetical protein